MKKIITMLMLAVMSFGTINQTYAFTLPQNKKDGTLDKRFKANKSPKKKNDTPDMRYKANKKTKKSKA